MLKPIAGHPSQIKECMEKLLNKQLTQNTAMTV